MLPLIKFSCFSSQVPSFLQNYVNCLFTFSIVDILQIFIEKTFVSFSFVTNVMYYTEGALFQAPAGCRSERQDLIATIEFQIRRVQYWLGHLSGFCLVGFVTDASNGFGGILAQRLMLAVLVLVLTLFLRLHFGFVSVP